jgi:hypothetical protein
MPRLLIPTASTASHLQAVTTAFRARLRSVTLDAPRAAQAGRPLIAQAIRPVAPAIAALPRPRGPSVGEANFPNEATRPHATAIAHSGARHP